MSVNLVDLVMQQVGGNVPGILGSLLGESADRTTGAVAGAVPAILGGLMGLASKGEEGISQLQVAADYQGDGMLDDLAGKLGDGKHTAVMEQGGDMLRSLLGDGMVGTLVGAIGKFSGFGSGSSKSLLGLIAPIVMSVLSRQKKEQGLDGGGLANLLMGQKDNIQSAMPSGLANALGGSGFLDGMMGSAASSVAGVVDGATAVVDQTASAVGEAAGTASDAARHAASTATAAASQGVEAVGEAAQSAVSSASEAASGASAAAAGAAKSGGSMFRWLLPLIILLALLWLAYTFLSGGDVQETVGDAGDAVSSAVETTTEAAGDAASAAGDAASAAGDAAGSALEAVTAMVGDVDVGSELTSTFDGLTETLTSITDAASAEAALPKLEEMSAGLDSLTGLADQLPEGAVSGITDLASSGLSSLDGVIANLESIPGVADVIKPVLDQIKEKLAAFTPA